MIPSAAIERYLKIKAYAEKGSDGEQKNARKLMQKMEVEWPGIAHQSENPPSDLPFQVPQGRNGVGFWDAARDALDLMAGRAQAPDLFLKYAQEMEEQRRYSESIPQPQMVKLTHVQAKALVKGVIHPFLADGMFGALKISAHMNPDEARYWEFYTRDPDNRALLCEEFGKVMAAAMAEFLAET